MVSRYLRRYPSIRRSRWDRKTGLFGSVSAIGLPVVRGNLRQVRKIDRAGKLLPLLSTAAATVLFQELDLFDRTIRDFLTEEIMSPIATTSHSLLLNGSRTR
jgi:hypothetical protein